MVFRFGFIIYIVKVIYLVRDFGVRFRVVVGFEVGRFFYV